MCDVQCAMGEGEENHVRRVTALTGVGGLMVLAACVPGPAQVMLPSAGVTATLPRTIRVQVREGTALVTRDAASIGEM